MIKLIIVSISMQSCTYEPTLGLEKPFRKSNNLANPIEEMIINDLKLKEAKEKESASWTFKTLEQTSTTARIEYTIMFPKSASRYIIDCAKSGKTWKIVKMSGVFAT